MDFVFQKKPRAKRARTHRAWLVAEDLWIRKRNYSTRTAVPEHTTISIEPLAPTVS